MNKAEVAKFVKRAQYYASKRSPEILVGIGIAGMVTSTIFAVRATPKALRLIEAEMINADGEELSKKDIVRVAWKPYIPAAVTGVVSVVCLAGASSVHIRRNAALATAYKLSEKALNEFKEKAIETVGEKKVNEIKQKVTEDQVKKNPVSNAEVVITGNGTSLCLETVSGRYFESDINTIQKIENDLNKRMLSENSISLTEFYVDLGLKSTSISDTLGWNLDKGLTIEFGSSLTPDGRPCVVIDYKYPPFYDFAKYW